MSTKKLISKAQSGIQFPVILQLAVADNTRYVRPYNSIEIAESKKAYEQEQLQKLIEATQKRLPLLKADTRSTEQRQRDYNRAIQLEVKQKANELAAIFGRALGANHDMTVDEVNQNTLNTANLMGYMIAPYLMTTLESGYYLGTGRPKEAAITAGVGYGLPIMFKGLLQLPNTARSYVVSRELSKGIKQATKLGDIRVPDSYFHNPNSAYRATTQAEVDDLRTIGHTRSASENSLAEHNYTQGIGLGWLKGDSYMQHVENSNNIFTRAKHENLLRPDGVILETEEGTFIPGYHGKTWGNPQSLSDIKITIPKKQRNKYLGEFYLDPGGGYAFAEYPLRGLVTTSDKPLLSLNISYFTRGNNGQWIYNGRIFPEKRIYQIGNQKYIPTLNIQDVLNTKISLNHVLPKLYVIPNFTSKHGSLAMPSTADTPVGWGNSPVLFLKNSAISKYPHQAYIGDGQVNTVNGVFGRNKDFSNYSLSELRDGLNSKMDKVKEVYLPEKSTPTTDENMIFNSKLRRYLSDRNPDAYIGPSYDELHFHSAIPLRDFKYAFLPDYETAPELLPLFDKYGIKTNFEFADKRGVDLEAFRKWITDNDKEIGFKKGGKLRLINRE